MNTRAYGNRDFFNQLLADVVGFEDIFNQFNVSGQKPHSFPPYDIVKLSDTVYNIVLAVAGFTEENVEVRQELNELIVSGKPNKVNAEYKVMSEGIAKRQFTRRWILGDNMFVKSAVLKDGLLTIGLERIIPEEQKPKIIPVKKAENLLTAE